MSLWIFLLLAQERGTVASLKGCMLLKGLLKIKNSMAVYLRLLGIGLLFSQKQAIITEQGINWTWLLLQKTDISVSPTKYLLMLMYEKEKSQNTKELCVASSWESIFCLPNLVILIWKSVWENKYQTEHCHFQNLFCDCSLENTRSKTIEILFFFFFVCLFFSC